MSSPVNIRPGVHAAYDCLSPTLMDAIATHSAKKKGVLGTA